MPVTREAVGYIADVEGAEATVVLTAVASTRVGVGDMMPPDPSHRGFK